MAGKKGSESCFYIRRKKLKRTKQDNGEHDITISNLQTCYEYTPQDRQFVSLLRKLHWLRVPERITFKLATLTFRCLHGTAPAYLAETLNRVADVDSRGRRQRFSCRQLVAALSATAPFLSQLRAHGTVYRSL